MKIIDRGLAKPDDPIYKSGPVIGGVRFYNPPKGPKPEKAALIGTITSSLKKNQKLQLVGFGTFTVAKRAGRKGRNPRTGEAIRIKASKSVRFKAGQTLKRSV